MNNFAKFLNEDQMRAVSVRKMSKWSTPTIVKALKFRLALGVHGYKFLVNSGYPFPCLETLGEKLQALKINSGIFSVLEEPLKAKVAGMSQIGRCCTISIDEMQINPVKNYNKFEKKFVGNITLERSERKQKKKENEKAVPVEDEYDCLEDMLREDEGDDCKADNAGHSTDSERKDLGTHLITILARGISSPWKQVIAIGITSGSTKPQALHKFVDEGIKFLENCGLYVTSLTSDMGTNNRAFWTMVGVTLQRAGDRKNFFMCNGHKVYLIADPCHLLKNLKLALQSGTTTIPEFIQEVHSLPTTNIDSSYVEALWHAEVNMKKELRKLHHLHFDDLHPDNFKKMHVGSAVHFFSHATAAALEDAVEKKILSEEALTTAWFIRKVNTWFAVVSSRERKTSITRRNCALRYLVLTDMMDIFENVRIKGTKWKLLNAGMVLSCLSLVDICEYLFSATSIEFVLLSRFSQDALENVFSQVRRKAGKTPTALQCQKVMKLISVSQFISKIDHTSYHNNADVFLIDFFSKKNGNEENGDTERLNDTFNIVHTVSRPFYEGAEINFSQRFDAVTQYNDLDAELLCNLSGIVTKAVLKKRICQDCQTFLSTDNVSDVSLTQFISTLR